jgi:hypothetical protein
MTRTEKIAQLVAKMEHADVLWWKAKEEHSRAAREEYDRLEQEIRADMAEIGIDFDAVRAEFEDWAELCRLLRAVL